MSLSFVWYSNEYRTEKEILDFAVTLNGEIQELGSFLQCAITRKDEIIWVMDNENFLSELEKEDYQELKKHEVYPKSSAVIEIGLNSKGMRSILLARWFCKKLLLEYPESVIMAFDKYYSYNTVEDIPCSYE